MKRLVVLFLMLMAMAAYAEPPPGHPSVKQAQDALSVPNDLPLEHEGKVLQSIGSNDYVYLQVTRKEGEPLWLAAPRAEIPVDSWIRYSEGVMMKDFYSRKHKRTFPFVMFVDRVKVLGN